MSSFAAILCTVQHYDIHLFLGASEFILLLNLTFVSFQLNKIKTLRNIRDYLNFLVRISHLKPPFTQAFNLPILILIRNFSQRGGFFIECGALDGETRSNTLVFEKELGWKGLLVEGDPKNFELVKKKNRKAWSANVCLSTKPYPNKVRGADGLWINDERTDVNSLH